MWKPSLLKVHNFIICVLVWKRIKECENIWLLWQSFVFSLWFFFGSKCLKQVD